MLSNITTSDTCGTKSLTLGSITVTPITSGSITLGSTGTSIGSTGTSTLGSITLGNNYYIGNGFGLAMIEIEVLGTKFEFYPDTIQQTYLAQIDFLGIGYWESMKKMSLTISNEDIRIFLDKKLKSWKRQQKIKKITDEFDCC